ncbi:large ribosomal subunit protein mL52-like [Argopecten irradians]|uniref:large ribosomal subunit protein mL52-like n=1 Tax=Argopecten irradians TaxID=31199 RepID=UPI00371AF3EA
MYRNCIIKLSHLVIPREAARNFSLSSITCKNENRHRPFCPEWKKTRFGSEWRVKQGKAMDGISYGPLTDLPDYTYLDGRPTPLSKGQLRRREMNKEMAKNVMKMMNELDFTKEFAEKRRQEQLQIEKLKSVPSFKPKGRHSHKPVRVKRNN